MFRLGGILRAASTAAGAAAATAVATAAATPVSPPRAHAAVATPAPAPAAATPVIAPTVVVPAATPAASTAVPEGGAGTSASASAAPAAADPVHSHPPVGTTFIKMDLSEHKLDHHLLHESLAGAERGLEEYVLHVATDRRHLMATARLGEKACGHPGIVHGGAIGALYDDSFGTLFFAAGLNGFTANLSIDYKKPLPAGTPVVIHAVIDKVEVSPRSGATKVFFKARMVDAATEKVVYSTATALFIAKKVPSHLADSFQLKEAPPAHILQMQALRQQRAAQQAKEAAAASAAGAVAAPPTQQQVA